MPIARAEIEKLEVTGVVTVDSPVRCGPLGAQQELERLNDGSHLAAKTIEPGHTLMVRDGVAFGAFGGEETRVIGGFRRPEAPQVSVPCSRPGCNTTTIFPLGTLDPKQGSCAHVLVPRHLGMSGLECRGCGLKIGAHALRAAGFLPENSPYDRRVQTMADECQRLKDENSGLLVENATLRRKMERRR